MGKVAGLLVAAALGALGLMVVVVYVQLDAAVARVTVGGPLDDAERGEIRDVVGQSVKGGILSADLTRLQEAIMALSWPRAVTVRRAWPAALEIEVEKPAVVARWQDAYLSSDGRIVRLPGSRSDLPVFDCSIAEPNGAMELFQSLSAASMVHGLTITRLEENELGEWLLTLTPKGSDGAAAGDLVVVLGSEHLNERLDRFLLVYRKTIGARHEEIARVDARYDNGVAVQWRTDPALVAAAEVGVNKTQW